MFTPVGKSSSAGIGRRAFLMGLGATLSLAVGAAVLGMPTDAFAGKLPEDILQGQMIISDSSLPTKWSSPAAYAAQLKKLHKKSVVYDKKTGKVQIYYAAFFALPVNDIQVNFVIYDITGGVANKSKKGAWEAFLGRKGERVLFNSVELDKEDVEMNKKYLFAIERGGKIIAKAEMMVLGEAPKYSGKVEFDEDEAKGKKPLQ